VSTLPDGATIGTCECGATTYREAGGTPVHANGQPCPAANRPFDGRRPETAQ
jgi:hypothetical protein